MQQWLTSEQGAGDSNSGLVSKEQILDFIQGELDRMDDGPPLGNLSSALRPSSVLPNLSGSPAPLLSQLDRCHIRSRGSSAGTGGTAEGGSRHRQHISQQLHHSRQQQQHQHQQQQHLQQHQPQHEAQTFEQCPAVHQVQQPQTTVDLPATDARASVNLASRTGPAPSAVAAPSAPSPLKPSLGQGIPPGLPHVELFNGTPQPGYHNCQPQGGQQQVAQFGQQHQQPSQQYYHQMHNHAGQSVHAFACAGRLTHVIASDGSASMDT
ncbi:hypothetical protein CLOM_g18420 [Closterium sp. NIES-68]|nr:hypothetical protein CLOM_g18420 [Closterium sp. NIES-68]